MFKVTLSYITFTMLILSLILLRIAKGAGDKRRARRFLLAAAVCIAILVIASLMYNLI